MSARSQYLWAQRWKILLTAQGIFTAGIMYKRFTDPDMQRRREELRRP